MDGGDEVEQSVRLLLVFDLGRDQVAGLRDIHGRCLSFFPAAFRCGEKTVEEPLSNQRQSLVVMPPQPVVDLIVA